MYFLVSYDIIDREDLNLNQKMTAIYLARFLDEKNRENPTELDLASMMKLSVDEIKLNMKVLISKGLVQEKTLDNSGEKEYKSPVFKSFSGLPDDVKFKIDSAFGFKIPVSSSSMLYLKAGEDLANLLEVISKSLDSEDPVEEVFYRLQMEESHKKNIENSDRHNSKENFQDKEALEFNNPSDLISNGNLSSHSSDVSQDENDIATQIGVVEKRIKERAANLKLKSVDFEFEKAKESVTNEDVEDKDEYSSECDDSDSEKLLNLLSESTENNSKKAGISKNDKTKLSPKDRAFLRASSVYKKTKRTNNLGDSKTAKSTKNIEI